MFGQLSLVVVLGVVALGVVVVEPLCVLVVVVVCFADVDVPLVAASATPPPLASTSPAATTANVLFGLISPPFIALMAMPPAATKEEVKRA